MGSILFAIRGGRSDPKGSDVGAAGTVDTRTVGQYRFALHLGET